MKSQNSWYILIKANILDKEQDSIEKQELSVEEVKEVQQGCAEGNYPLGKHQLLAASGKPHAHSLD